MSIYTEDVKLLEINLRIKIRELKTTRVVAMGARNLKQIISTRGLRIPVRVFDQAFNEALANVTVKGFEVMAD